MGSYKMSTFTLQDFIETLMHNQCIFYFKMERWFATLKHCLAKKDAAIGNDTQLRKSKNSWTATNIN